MTNGRVKTASSILNDNQSLEIDDPLSEINDVTVKELFKRLHPERNNLVPDILRNDPIMYTCCKKTTGCTGPSGIDARKNEALEDCLDYNKYNFPDFLEFPDFTYASLEDRSQIQVFKIIMTMTKRKTTKTATKTGIYKDS
ncbi:hypothetical protein GJ496_010969 [Pomphorhynchus laevis]|nr:hypothetical protein GJ496_010969 [Pomphorhynchus laevis]